MEVIYALAGVRTGVGDYAVAPAVEAKLGGGFGGELHELAEKRLARGADLLAAGFPPWRSGTASASVPPSGTVPTWRGESRMRSAAASERSPSASRAEAVSSTSARPGGRRESSAREPPSTTCPATS